MPFPSGSLPGPGPIFQPGFYADNPEAAAAETPIEVLIAADPFSSGVEDQQATPDVEDPISIDMGVAVSVSMDISFFFQIAAPTLTTEEIVAGYDLFQIADYESSHMPRAPPWDDEYSTPHDVTYIFADRNVDVVDTLDVAITDTSQVDKFEGIEGLVAAGYSDFQGDVEPLVPETLDEYTHVSTLDVSGFISTQAPQEAIEVLIAADPNYGQDTSLVEHWEADELTVENDGNVDTTFIFADRLIDVSDTLDVAVVDTSQVDRLEGIEGLVAANYSDFQGDVESLSPDTLEEYTHVSTLDTSAYTATQVPPETIENLVAANYSTFQGDVEAQSPQEQTEYYGNTEIEFIFADRNVDVSDTLDVAVVDTSQVDRLEGIEGLVAAGYSTFQGDVEPLTAETLEEYTHVTSLEVTAYIATQAPPEAIEALIAASYSIFQGDVEYLETPQLTTEDSSATTVVDTTFIFADRQIAVTDTLDVAVGDVSQVDRFETIEGLVASNYTTFQGDVEALSEPTWDEYTHVSTLEVAAYVATQAPPEAIEVLIAADPNYGQDPNLIEFQKPDELTTENDFNVDTSFIFADRNVDVTDTLDVAVIDTSQVDRLESIEGLTAAGYSTFQGDVEAQDAPTWDDYQSTTAIDVAPFIAGQAPPAADTELAAANYSTFQGDVEFLEPAGLTIEDYSNQVVADTSFLSADVFINVTDTLDVAVDDTSALQRLEGIEGLVAAGYSTFYGTVEALQPEVLTVESDSTATLHDVTYILATININVVDTLDVAIVDTSAVQQVSGIVELVAANYSTFFGTVEALSPPETTIENSSSGSLEIPAAMIEIPTPPEPWGPFTEIVDDYTYTGVVEIGEAVTEDETYEGVEEVHETTTDDDVYEPVDPEEGG